jgi:hypothetical protein
MSELIIVLSILVLITMGGYFLSYIIKKSQEQYIFKLKQFCAKKYYYKHCMITDRADMINMMMSKSGLSWEQTLSLYNQLDKKI